ncbi:MAG TPA: sulfate permease [Terriglobales bacterium]
MQSAPNLKSSSLRRHIAVLDWPATYQKAWFQADLIAGLTSAAVVIPKAMAYATIAGLPVQVGLYTAFIPAVIYAILGTSRPLSVTTTTTLAILTSTELAQVVPSGDIAAMVKATAVLTFLVGIALILAWLLRLGFVANFISEPVLVGFKAGIGVVIILDQVPKILGIHFPRGSFLTNIVNIVHQVPNVSLFTLAVGLVTMLFLAGAERLSPRIPAPLAAVALGIFGASFLDLHAHGVELVGRIPAGLPPITVPEFTLAAQLWPGALGIALMSFTETIAAGRAFARVDDPTPRPNRELLATGLANAIGAFWGSMPAGGGTTQTAVNHLAGARSQIAELVLAGTALATMLLLSPLIALMPQATLAAVVIVYSVGLIRPREFSSILKIRRTEFVWALTAFAGVVLFGTLKGILVAIVVSLIALSYQAANPAVYAVSRKRGTNVFRPLSDEHYDDETFPGLLLLRMEGRIFFANAERVAEKIRALIRRTSPRIVAIDLSAVPDLEYTALRMLIEGERRQRVLGISTWLVGLNPEVLDVVQRAGLDKVVGREGMHFNLEQVVAKYLEQS